MTENDDFLVVYGSQTGQSETLSEEIAEKARNAGLNPRKCCVDKHQKEFWIEREKFLVIVISSTGDGDPPDNAEKFVRQICKRTLPLDFLSNLRFALLGLGDSNYSTYQGCPKRIEKRLLELSATKFYESGWPDDAVGLELIAEPWMDGLIPALKGALSGKESLKRSIIPDPIEETADKCSELTISDIKNSEAKTVPAKFTCVLPKSSKKTFETNENENDENCETLDLAECQCVWSAGIASLVSSDLLADETNLRVPIAAEPYLAVSLSHENLDDRTLPWQNGCPFPGTLGEIEHVKILSLNRITGEGAKKAKFEISLDIEGTSLCYEPGDAFYFIFPNPADEVEYLLRRLKLVYLSDKRCEISVASETKHEKAQVPKHYPKISTLRHILTWCTDIRRTPGRPVLRILAEYTKDENEKRRILELCSSQGLKEFTEFVRKAGLSLADVLHAFPSCLPPVERLLEHLPRLQPRPYSVASSTLASHGRVRFAYSEVKIPNGDGRFYDRAGLCTGWLSDRVVGEKISVIFQEPKYFRLPDKNAETTPLIMIGPGTGVSPFIGFLEHLKALKSETCLCVPRWLFFGCRNMDVDFIYKNDMESFKQEKILSHLILCESQPEETKKECDTKPKYVQHGLKQNSKELSELILNKKFSLRAKIYVCGDAKGMSKEVFEAFAEIIAENSDRSQVEAVKYLAALKEKKLYVEDVWA